MNATNAITSGGFGDRVDRKAGVILLALGLLLLATACGGAYSKPPSTVADPLVEVRVIAGSQLISALGVNLSLHADGEYESSANGTTSKDLTTTASWSTSDGAVATVDKGVVTGNGIGTATTSATFGGKSGSVLIFVGLTAAIVITPEGPFSLAATPSLTFKAIESFSDGSTLDVSGPAFWNSSNQGIASVYPYLGGEVTLVAPGTTTITATMDTGEVGSLDVTVTP